MLKQKDDLSRKEKQDDEKKDNEESKKDSRKKIEINLNKNEDSKLKS